MWKEVLLGAFLLWIGTANLRPALGLYDAHRGTLRGMFLLVCECALLIASGAAITLGASPLWMRRTEPVEAEEDWVGINARRLRRLAVLSFLGLAWCLGSLR
jgi:hypothetical protein